MSATCLKTAGRSWEEEAAEGWKKPASGNVAGGPGTVGGNPANPRGACEEQAVDSLFLMRCRGTNPRRGAIWREQDGGFFGNMP